LSVGKILGLSVGANCVRPKNQRILILFISIMRNKTIIGGRTQFAPTTLFRLKVDIRKSLPMTREVATARLTEGEIANKGFEILICLQANFELCENKSEF
jgi:hypothetical protein